jgi:hypothetical protein
LPLLASVEGLHDAEFLRRISRMIHTERPDPPDLTELECRGELIFVPMGGGNLAHWTQRFAVLGKAEFHLLDRETPPETFLRQALARRAHARRRCRAFVTLKRALENYLHPDAIFEARGLRLEVRDQGHVPTTPPGSSFWRATSASPGRLFPRERAAGGGNGPSGG